MFDLTVSIVVYKEYSDVKQVINLIEQYTDKSIRKKVYIIDNTDKESINITEREKLEQLIDAYHDVEYISTGINIGFGKGHNYVLDKLDSKYHAIVNPDILFVEDAFLKILRYMDDNNIGMCIPRIEDNEGNLQAVYRRDLTISDMFIRMFLKNCFKKRQYYHTMQDMDYTKPFQVPFGQGSFLVIRTSLYKEIGGFDDRFFMYVEDADLCRRVNEKAELMYFPDAKVIHRWEKGSHKDKKLLMYHIRSTIEYFKKWGVNII